MESNSTLSDFCKRWITYNKLWITDFITKKQISTGSICVEFNHYTWDKKIDVLGFLKNIYTRSWVA